MASFERTTSGTLRAAVSELTATKGVRFESLAPSNRLELLQERPGKEVSLQKYRQQGSFSPAVYSTSFLERIFDLSKSKMEKTIRDKGSGLSMTKMLSSTDFTQAALTSSRAEQLLLQSILYLEKLSWLPSLFCLQTRQRSEETGLRAWVDGLQRCCFPSAYTLNLCLSLCPGARVDQTTEGQRDTVIPERMFVWLLRGRLYSERRPKPSASGTQELSSLQSTQVTKRYAVYGQRKN